ncbi:sensor histidine kinase [Clostridium folliculivorans]|uniref:sensor histidine kinase n=1 Tax=Clostridium folliculivorans TaxID=2886038 RepID=UPI0021C3062A|nr:sensor histidine kinase [Clostridium folliculivorans]GKU30484.1 two-component sensor histidine kinase [Clostridium folliculivorans]
MEYLIRILIFVAVIGKFIIQGSASALEVSLLLSIAAVNIFKHKYKVTWQILIIEAIVITFGCSYSSNFTFLYALIAYDAGSKDLRYFALPIALFAVCFSGLNNSIEVLVLIFMAFIVGNLTLKFSNNISSFKETYDNERRYRYELEAAKQKLLNSAKEAAYIAEIRERNRIAREIHDTVGHSLAGILLQLQVVQKLKNRDEEKSDSLLKDSIVRLSDSLEVMRNTVHNIRPSNPLGLEYIESIINNFNYCTVNFKPSGDFKSLPANVLETISSDVKEALTNAYKYSKATSIDIKIDVMDKSVRVYIKDNGEGCASLKEGFGLMGIRERIKNLGGTVSFSGENGFIILYVIPLEKDKGEELNEGNNS